MIDFRIAFSTMNNGLGLVKLYYATIEVNIVRTGSYIGSYSSVVLSCYYNNSMSSFEDKIFRPY